MGPHMTEDPSFLGDLIKDLPQFLWAEVLNLIILGRLWIFFLIPSWFLVNTPNRRVALAFVLAYFASILFRIESKFKSV